MAGADQIKNEIYAANKEVFELAAETRAALLTLLKAFNARKIRLTHCPPHQRIFLFFLVRTIKTYSAIYILCGEGYGQDACPLLRTLLETLIAAKYILHYRNDADREAVRFVEYKWVILKRYLADIQRELTREASDPLAPEENMVAREFQEYKQKYRITSDKALVTWSGKTIRDMAKLADPRLLKEYESAFRVDSQFSHPSIMGDKEYLSYGDNALLFFFLPSASGVVLNLKRAVTYMTDFLMVFNELFSLEGAKTLKKLQRRIDEVFQTEKYQKALSLAKSLPSLDKTKAGKMLVQFNLDF